MKMFGKNKSANPIVIDSVIGQGTKFRGDITAHGTVHAAGEVEGSIEALGDVLVGEQGKVNGSVRGRRIIVAGEIKGNIITESGLEITSTGRVIGDITGDKLIMDEGAFFQGKVDMAQVVKREGKQSPTLEELTSRIAASAN